MELELETFRSEKMKVTVAQCIMQHIPLDWMISSQSSSALYPFLAASATHNSRFKKLTSSSRTAGTPSSLI
jgi:hypothetical protein